MTDPVTLDELAALDVEICALLMRVDDLIVDLGHARNQLANARARQHRLIDRYNADAARPL